MKTKQQYIKLIKEIYQTDKVNYCRKIQNNLQLLNFIQLSTPLLTDKKYSLTTKIYWILNNLTDFPICPTCGKNLDFLKICELIEDIQHIVQLIVQIKVMKEI